MNDQLERATVSSPALNGWLPICLTDEYRQHVIDGSLEAAKRRLEDTVARQYPSGMQQREFDKWQAMTLENFREHEEKYVIADIQRDRDRRDQLFRLFIERRGKRYQDCTFANYIATSDEQRHVVSQLREYVANLQANIDSGKSVVLFGPSGTGKDHLLVAMARCATLQYRKIVRWTSGALLRSDLRCAMSEYSDDTEFGIVDPLVAADVLTISDPSVSGASLTDYQSDVFYRIIDERYNEQKPIWVTVNCANRAEMNAAIGVSIADRLIDGALTIGCEWGSYRKPK